MANILNNIKVRPTRNGELQMRNKNILKVKQNTQIEIAEKINNQIKEMPSTQAQRQI